MSERTGHRGDGRSFALMVTAFGVLLIAAAQLWQAAEVRSPTARFTAPGPIGSLESFQLTNGLVVYGNLAGIGHGTVLLKRVYEVEASTEPAKKAGGQPVRITRLVRRHSHDWHGPGMMAIPIDKILFMESVPGTATVEKLIRADQEKTGILH